MTEEIKGITSTALALPKSANLPETPPTQAEEAVVVSINRGAFSYRLEKHIDDYYKGRGNVSKDVSAELNLKDISATNILVKVDPKANLMYNTYQTALNYGHRARYVRSMGEFSEDLKTILSKLA